MHEEVFILNEMQNSNDNQIMLYTPHNLLPSLLFHVKSLGRRSYPILAANQDLNCAVSYRF